MKLKLPNQLEHVAAMESTKLSPHFKSPHVIETGVRPRPSENGISTRVANLGRCSRRSVFPDSRSHIPYFPELQH